MSIISDRGRNGELMVAGYLRKNGCMIAKMNYHSRYGEIDIIAETDKYVLFVEVKLRKKDSLVSPAESVSISKQKKIIMTAQDFLSKTHLEELQPRFDVAEIFDETDSNGKPCYRIHYIKNAFGI